MSTVGMHCDLSHEMYADKTIREALEEDFLTMVIREHGKVITMQWRETFNDEGELIHRLWLTYKERQND